MFPVVRRRTPATIVRLQRVISVRTDIHQREESTMNSRTNRRLIALACALIGAAVLQACAMTTGQYVPQRGAATNRSMVSHYDAYGQPVAQRSVNRTMTVVHEKGGVHDFRYY